MVRKFVKLERIEHNDPVTVENNREFCYQLQYALLLALREQGRLSPMQHRHAEEKLRKQRIEQSKKKQSES